MLREIQRLVETADFDGALKKLETIQGAGLASAIRSEPLNINRMRLACMASDVYDYAGRFDDDAFFINLVATEARRQVEGFLESAKVDNYRSPIEDSQLIKQGCWALIHVATAEYRKNQDAKALSLLDGPVKEALLRLERQKANSAENPDSAQRLAYLTFGVHAAQSRLWYGIGLIRRQRRDERSAREAFTRSIIYASQGVEAHSTEGNLALYDYSVGKAMGLGLGWVSYSEARLSESLAELVAARRLLATAKGVRFIRAYIDVIYSRALLSAYADVPERVEEAINTLKRGSERLSDHEFYRHRADYAMALSLVNRYLLQKRNRDTPGSSDVTPNDLYAVLQAIGEAKSGWLAENDKPTLCNFLILESRIRRIQKDYDAALEAAIAASNLGESIDFVKADCSICLGEAYYHKLDYPIAIEHFRRAREAARGSRKLRAASELHLAQTYLASGNRAEAREYFQKWKISSAGVENVFIRNLSSELGTMLNDFVVGADVESLMAETHLNELRHWLAAEAVRRWGKLKREDQERNFKEQMDVSARTIKRWMDRDFREPKEEN